MPEAGAVVEAASMDAARVAEEIGFEEEADEKDAEKQVEKQQEDDDEEEGAEDEEQEEQDDDCPAEDCMVVVAAAVWTPAAVAAAKRRVAVGDSRQQIRAAACLGRIRIDVALDTQAASGRNGGERISPSGGCGPRLWRPKAK